MAETLTKDEIREFHERVASGEISGAGTRIEQVYHAAVGTLLDELEAMAALLKTPVGTCWDCKHWHHLELEAKVARLQAQRMALRESCEIHGELDELEVLERRYQKLKVDFAQQRVEIGRLQAQRTASEVIDEQRKELKRLRAALEIYANRNNWYNSEVCHDDWQWAGPFCTPWRPAENALAWPKTHSNRQEGVGRVEQKLTPSNQGG